ncbi:MAG: hypothetical protein M3N41_12585 [Acidobacteriota bacterium]|nr:hypothetical protein [Acidobacteriota bacterium]
MKQFIVAAAALLISVSASAAGWNDVKTVYLLPMSNGLDQYLAGQLTSGSVLQVVTDPQKADAVLTDHVGQSFEETLADLYGNKPVPSQKAADKTEDAGAAAVRSGVQGQRGRGNVFLVNRRTHDVLWSFYESPGDRTPNGMRRTASKISAKLAQSIKGK